MDRILASLMFFTRLPWWRLRTVPKEAFEHVVDWWPLVGWLTGGVMAGVLVASLACGLSPEVSALLAIASRLLLTGALHEDGLADFCDGFGGGTSRARTLLIMKDSHIGTYGVLGLIMYIAFLCAALLCIAKTPVQPNDTLWHAAALILLFDTTAKSAASLITGQLPYARTAEEAKNQVVYVGRSWQAWLLHSLRCALAIGLPLALCVWLGMGRVVYLLPVPFAVELLLMLWMRRRIGGYTGDCCGALFLLCELSFYISWLLLA